MNLNAIITSIYAILLFVGGSIGYYKAHSLPSLAMGSIFAILLGVSAWGMYKKCNYSYYSALILSALLTAFFAFRFATTYKFFPPGMMCLVSLGVLVTLLFNRPAQKVE